MKSLPVKTIEIDTLTPLAINDDNKIIRHNDNCYKIDLPIFFTYGDSDLQLLIYEVGKTLSRDKYYIVMERAFRLLLAFKPITNYLLLPASSFVQSNLTQFLANKFRCFSECHVPHFYLLRREPDWKYYIAKRKEKNKGVIAIPRYRNFYSSKVLEKFNGFSTFSRNIFAGQKCSEAWIEEAIKIVKLFPRGSNISSSCLEEMAEEILFDGIFVWENIEKKLKERGANIPEWSVDLQIALLKSYLCVSGDFVCFPYGIELPWELHMQRPAYYYTDLKLLHGIIKVTDLSKLFFSVNPSSFNKFISNKYFMKFKSIIEKGTCQLDIIKLASDNRIYISKSIKNLYI